MNFVASLDALASRDALIHLLKHCYIMLYHHVQDSCGACHVCSSARMTLLPVTTSEPNCDLEPIQEAWLHRVKVLNSCTLPQASVTSKISSPGSYCPCSLRPGLRPETSVALKPNHRTDCISCCTFSSCFWPCQI